MNTTSKFYKPVGQITLAVILWIAFFIGVWLSWTNQEWWPMLFAIVLGFVHNIMGQSIALHKLFTHRQLAVTPVMEWVLASWSVLTGYPATTYTAVHRLHHLCADTDRDPHAPINTISFLRCLLGATASSVGDWKDLKSGIHDWEYHTPFGRVSQYFLVIWLILISITWLVWGWQGVIYGLLVPVWYCQVLGGGMINALGHWHGYRNFDTQDRSTNSWLANLFTPGEGYQNNHHHDASMLNFAVRPGEFDLGYWVLAVSGAIKLPHTNRVPSGRDA